MRCAIFMLSLALLASFSFGAVAAPPKSEPAKPPQAAPEPTATDTAKAELPKKEAPKSDEAKAYVEAQTGITFPAKLGAMVFTGSYKYPQPGLGVSVNYKTAEGLFVNVDVYIYDLGKKDLGTGADSDAVRAEIKSGESDIRQLEKMGHYAGVTKIADTPATLKMGGKDLAMLGSVFEFSRVDAGGKTMPEPVISTIYLTAYKGQFFKIRCTYAAVGKDKGAEILQGFLTALGEAMAK